MCIIEDIVWVVSEGGYVVVHQLHNRTAHLRKADFPNVLFIFVTLIFVMANINTIHTSLDIQGSFQKFKIAIYRRSAHLLPLDPNKLSLEELGDVDEESCDECGSDED